MIKKAEIAALIDTIIDGGVNTAVKVREVFKDGEKSILNNSYGEILKDTQLTTNVFTKAQSTGYAYGIDIVKQGRKVTLNCFVQNLSNSGVLSDIADLTNADYLPEDFARYGTTAIDTRLNGSNSIVGAELIPNFNSNPQTFRLKFTDIVYPGEFMRFQLTYYTKD